MAGEAHDSRNDTELFPWHLGVYDAHCHPTDMMSSTATIPSMKARVLTVMATRSQDQDLVSQVAEKYSLKSPDAEKWAREECVVPCFGWHPWFSHQMYFSVEDARETSKDGEVLQGEDKIRHYQSVLRPERKEISEEDKRLFSSLPDPMPFETFLTETRKNLKKYPLALVGEIGLDRSFRIPETWISESEDQRDGTLTPGGREGRRLSPFRVDLAHQRKIVKKQLQLAAEMNRGVSMHGVQAHGVVYEVIKETYEGHEKEVLSKRERKKRGSENPTALNGDQSKAQDAERKPYPPRICLHSYSGNSSSFKQYLNPSIPVDIFVSFSTAINLDDNLDDETPKAFEEMVKTVPDHMLLVESDLHTAGGEMDQRLEDIVRRICTIKGWGLENGVKRLGQNWSRFVFG